MQYHQIKTLKEQIIYCLEKYPETRNSDVKLTNSVWIEFYPEYIKNNSTIYLNLTSYGEQKEYKRKFNPVLEKIFYQKEIKKQPKLL